MTQRAEVRTEVTVDRPVEEVYEYVADLARHGEWSPKPYRVEGLTGPVAVGTSYASYGWLPGDKDHRNDVSVTALEPPRRVVLTSVEKGEEFVNTFTLTAKGATTTVERVIDMPKPTGMLGLLFPVLVPTVIRPGVAKGMAKLKARLEDGAP